MKNNTAKLLVAALATSAIVAPISTAAATTEVEQGVYFAATNEFFTVEQLGQLSMKKIGDLFQDNQQSEVYIYQALIGTATLEQANNSSFIAAANQNGFKDEPEKIIPTGKYVGEDGKEINVVNPGENVDLKVESVSAINQTVFATTADQLLTFEVNGETADLEALEEAGYTLEFLASKDVFEDKETGELKADLSAGSFDYQVVVSKEGQDDITSEFAKVTVVEGSAVASIDTYTLTANGVELNSTTLVSDETATIAAEKGTSVDGKEIENVSGATYKSSNNSVALVNAATGEITPVQAGEVTITITAGKATKEVNLTITDEARKVTTVTADKASIGTVTGAESTLKLTVKDQYGDLLSGKTLTAATVQNSDKKNILTVNVPGATSTKGEVTVTVKGDAENTGSGSLVFKDADNTVLTVPVTVGSSKEVAKRVLELASTSESKDSTIDVIDADDNELTFVYNQYAAGDLLIGPEKSNTYNVNVVQPSSGDVVTVDKSTFATTGQVKLTAKKAGEATVQIKEGDLVRASYKVTVTDSTPSISAVTFEKDPAITADGEYLLDNVLKASGIKLTSTETVALESDEDGKGVITIKSGAVQVGSFDFVSTVGEVTVADAGEGKLKIQILDEDPNNNDAGTITLRVKDNTGKVVGAQAITVNNYTATEKALTALNNVNDNTLAEAALKNPALDLDLTKYLYLNNDQRLDLAGDLFPISEPFTSVDEVQPWLDAAVEAQAVWEIAWAAKTEHGNGDWSAVKVNTFKAAGITGVTNENFDSVKAKLESKNSTIAGKSDLDSAKATIQQLVDEVIDPA